MKFVYLSQWKEVVGELFHKFKKEKQERKKKWSTTWTTKVITHPASVPQLHPSVGLVLRMTGTDLAVVPT